MIKPKHYMDVVISEDAARRISHGCALNFNCAATWRWEWVKKSWDSKCVLCQNRKPHPDEFFCNLCHQHQQRLIEKHKKEERQRRIEYFFLEITEPFRAAYIAVKEWWNS